MRKQSPFGTRTVLLWLLQLKQKLRKQIKYFRMKKYAKPQNGHSVITRLENYKLNCWSTYILSNTAELHAVIHHAWDKAALQYCNLVPIQPNLFPIANPRPLFQH